jgi:hypothetical protein
MVGKFLASGCIAALIAGAASSAPLQIKLTGTVYNSNDSLGVFGAPGASLIGQQFTAIFLFDPALHAPTVNSATEYYNSTSWWTSGPSIGLGASLTINGHTVHVGGQNASELHVKESADQSLMYLAQFDYDLNSGVQTIMVTNISDYFDIGYGSPTLGPWSGDVMPANSFTSWRLEGDFGTNEWVSMDARHVTIGAPTAAPEPASWALMVGGFGMIGCAFRARARGLRYV